MYYFLTVSTFWSWSAYRSVIAAGSVAFGDIKRQFHPAVSNAFHRASMDAENFAERLMSLEKDGI